MASLFSGHPDHQGQRLLEFAPVQHPAFAQTSGLARIFRRSGSPQVFRRVRTSPPSPILPAGRARRCSRSVAASAPTRINFARHGAQVTAVDLTEKSLDVARQRLKSSASRIACASSKPMPNGSARSVPVETYDLVYSFGVIHHTPHPERVLEEIRKYVTPQSTVKIMVYNRWSWKVLWILFGLRQGQILEAEPLDRGILGSANRMPGDLQLFAILRPAAARRSRLSRHGRHRWITFFLTASRNT